MVVVLGVVVVVHGVLVATRSFGKMVVVTATKVGLHLLLTRLQMQERKKVNAKK